MIKVTFKKPQLFSTEEGLFQCAFVFCNNLSPRMSINDGLCFDTDEYIGLIKIDNIKSIEHVKPTD